MGGTRFSIIKKNGALASAISASAALASEVLFFFLLSLWEAQEEQFTNQHFCLLG